MALLIEAAVARMPSTRTLLNLSMNTVAEPWVALAHPSGTFTANAPPGVGHGTDTRVSGMSPGGSSQ